MLTSSRHSSAMAFLLLPALTVAALAGWASAGAVQANEDQSLPSFLAILQKAATSEHVEFLIGTHTYRIPRSYFSYVSKNADGKVERVVMEAELPDLGPIPGNRMLPPDGIYNRIVIHISVDTRDYAAFLTNPRTLLTKEGVIYDLQQYNLNNKPSSFVPLDQSYTSPVGRQVAFRCLGVAEDVKLLPSTVPICQSGYHLVRGGEGLFYQFYYPHLRNWREIDTIVNRFVQSLRKEGM